MPQSENAVAGLISPATQTAIPLLGTRVTAEVAGRGARVTIAQRFRNTGKKPLEAVYKFPVPEAAAVCGFRAIVGDRKIEGKVEDREEAFKQYDEAMAQGHGAYLLDQERPNIFTLSVGNLKPKQEATIEIEYVTTLPTFGAETRFSLPTTISPRYVPADTPDEDGIKASDKVNPEFALEVPYGLNMSLDILGAEGIASVESPSHRTRQTFGEGKIHVEFTSDDVKMDRDFVLNVTRKEGFENRGYATVVGDDLFLQVDLCPKEENENTGKEQEIVFVLDCSGSMGGNSINEAKKALTAALGRLEPGSRFNLYRFGSKYEKAFRTSVAYSQEHLDAAREWVSEVDADLGGTELLAPLKDIYGKDGKDRTVLLITDGEMGNEAQVFDLIRDNASDTRFFTIGIGYGPNEHLLRASARMGNGACEMIAPGERIERKTLRLFGKMMGRSISDVNISGVGKIVQAPATPVLFTGESTSVFARVHGNGTLHPKKVTVSGNTYGKEVAWEVPISMLRRESAPVSTLWAREAIRDIEEGNSTAFAAGSRQERGKSDKARDAALALSKEFGMASFAASFVAVEERKEEDKAVGEATLVKVPVMITKGWHGVGRSAARPVIACRMMAQALPMENVLSKISSSNARPLMRKRMFHPDMDYTATPAMVQDDGRMSRLMDILACQRADGGFSLDEKGAKALGTSLESIREAAKEVSAHKGLDPYVLACTALVFAYLLGPAVDLIETWGTVAEKSRKWLEKVTKTFDPKVAGKPLTTWAGEFFKRRRRAKPRRSF